ncbi:MAG: dihydropyrimidinase [Candidatus Promineifilaceae bacterium]
MFDTVIKGGTIVTASNVFKADIGITGETIAGIGHNLHGHRKIDATGKLVTPGAVDIHVHMQMPLGGGVVSADTFYTGTRAAAFGGTTTIVDFVDTKANETMLEALAKRRAEADPQVVIDYGLHMTIVPSDMSKLDQLPAVVEAGCGSFKLYMAYGFCLSDAQLYQALAAVHRVDGMSVVHAENWDLICHLQQVALAEGKVEPRWHPRTRPAEFEAEAASRVIDMAAYIGTPLHIFHVSCAEVVAQIKTARAKGLPVTGETCPQYLFKNWDAFEAEGVAGALPTCAPPIREQAQQDALWAALSAGDLQMVTTDHCPFNSADKARGLGNFTQIPGGVPSIEMRFPALYSKGVCEGHLSLSQWVDRCCTTPARLLGLSKKGDVVIGHDADLVIFDPHQEKVLSAETLHENVDWTLYDGLTVEGWPTHVFSHGKLIIERDRCYAEAGSGRFLKIRPL